VFVAILAQKIAIDAGDFILVTANFKFGHRVLLIYRNCLASILSIIAIYLVKMYSLGQFFTSA
jgi:hypothetical protein